MKLMMQLNSRSVKKHIIIRECEFKKLNVVSNIKFIQQLKKNEVLSEPEMIKKILNGEVHGFVEADLTVTEEARKEFIDFPPLFARQTVSIEDLDINQQEYVKKLKLMTGRKNGRRF